MAAESRLDVSSLVRYTGTTGSRYGRGVFDGGGESTRLPSSEKTTVDSGRKARIGLDADDTVLVRAALVGQVWAQREIWFRFAPMVYGLFRRALGPQYDHEDLTQEVFLRVFRNLHSIEKLSAIRSFVYSVAVRVVSEEVRRFAWRRRIIEERPVVSTESTSLPADFEVRETLWCIQQTLDRMRDKYRAVFILRHVEGLDLQEVASALGISDATVKRYLAKALASVHKSVLGKQVKGRIRLDRSTRLLEGKQ